MHPWIVSLERNYSNLTQLEEKWKMQRARISLKIRQDMQIWFRALCWRYFSEKKYERNKTENVLIILREFNLDTSNSFIRLSCILNFDWAAQNENNIKFIEPRNERCLRVKSKEWNRQCRQDNPHINRSLMSLIPHSWLTCKSYTREAIWPHMNQETFLCVNQTELSLPLKLF